MMLVPGYLGYLVCGWPTSVREAKSHMGYPLTLFSHIPGLQVGSVPDQLPPAGISWEDRAGLSLIDPRRGRDCAIHRMFQFLPF